jgi:hypothetical protein
VVSSGGGEVSRSGPKGKLVASVFEGATIGRKEQILQCPRGGQRGPKGNFAASSMGAVPAEGKRFRLVLEKACPVSAEDKIVRPVLEGADIGRTYLRGGRYRADIGPLAGLTR